MQLSLQKMVEIIIYTSIENDSLVSFKRWKSWKPSFWWSQGHVKLKSLCLCENTHDILLRSLYGTFGSRIHNLRVILIGHVRCMEKLTSQREILRFETEWPLVKAAIRQGWDFGSFRGEEVYKRKGYACPWELGSPWDGFRVAHLLCTNELPLIGAASSTAQGGGIQRPSSL